MSARAGVSPCWSSSFYYPLSQHNTGSGQAGRRETELQGEGGGRERGSSPRLCSWAHLWINVTPPGSPPPTLPSSLLWPHRFLFGPAHPPCTRATRLLQPRTHPSTLHPLVSSVNSSSCPLLPSRCPHSCNHISKPVKTSIVTVIGLFSCGGKCSSFFALLFMLGVEFHMLFHVRV